MMQYKTIILQLLEQHPQMHRRLRQTRQLLPTLEHMASQLKASHEAWKDHLSQRNPAWDASQIASSALELALESLEASLPAESPTDDNEALSIDQAMAFLRRHTPPV